MSDRATDNLDTLLDRIRWQIEHHHMIAQWIDNTSDLGLSDPRSERERCRIDGLLEAWEELSRCKYGELKRPAPWIA